MIFFKEFIFSYLLFSPVQLEDYKMVKADFNMGDTVFENNVYLSDIEDRTFKIKSTEGEQIFCMWDFLALFGSFVEFEICDSDLQIRCVFETPAVAKNLSHRMIPKVHHDIAFPTFAVTQVYEDLTEYAATSIRIQSIDRGILYEEMRNRFIVFSQADVPAMIFSAGHFNLSPVMSDGRVLLVIQVYDIEKGKLVRLKILFKFRDNETANHFHEFVTQEPSCTDSMIPVEIPSHLSP